jgi:hypothetical protein
MHRALLILSIVLFAAGCAKEEKRAASPALEIMKKDLRWLKRDAGSKAAVIFEEVTTKKFVQFSGQGLFVDLPHQTLSPEEMERADRVMARLGVQKSSYPLGEGAARYTQTAFQKDLAGDESTAIAIAETVFTEVFLLPPGLSIRATRIE